jgi:NDP-sugar pyrophosphorylase family protein
MRPVGLVPAAGYATRLGELSGSKEALDVRGRPVLDYLVERLRAADCADVRVVTRADKRDVVELAGALGATVVIGRPHDVAGSLLLAADGLEPETPVLFGFPDTIWEPVDGFVRLLGGLGPGVDAVLGLFRTPDLTRSDVAVVGEAGLVTAVQVKPERPASDVIWGCAATTAGVLGGLRGVREPGLLFDRLARAGRVAGVHLSDRWLDVGTPEALLRARSLLD